MWDKRSRLAVLLGALVLTSGCRRGVENAPRDTSGSRKRRRYTQRGKR